MEVGPVMPFRAKGVPHRGEPSYPPHMSNDVAASDPARKPSGLRRKWVRWALVVAALVLIARWADIELLGHWEVRIDSGDLRRRGSVFSSWPERLSGAERSCLLTASGELGIPARWCSVRYSAPSNGDIGGRHFLYSGAAFWLGEEPGLGKKILLQIAKYFEYPPSESGWPEATRFCFGIEWDDVQKHQRIDEELLGQSLAEELKELEYTPRPGGTLERILHKSGD